MGPGSELENDNVRKALKSAIAVQKDVIERLKTEGGSVEEERIFLAELTIELAKYMAKNEKND